MEPALARECAGAPDTRCVFGVTEALRTAFAAPDQARAVEDSAALVQQLERLGRSLMPAVTQYAVSVLAGSQGATDGTAGTPSLPVAHDYALKPVLRLLAAAPVLLGTFLGEVERAALRTDGQEDGSASRERVLRLLHLLCEVMSAAGIKAKLLGLQQELAHAIGTLRAAAVVKGDVTDASQSAADVVGRLESMYRTLFGLNLQ